MNDKIKEFINDVVKVLEHENIDRKECNQSELNIPFMIAPLYQQLIEYDYMYQEFIEDIDKYYYSLSYCDDTTDGYTNGHIDVYLINRSPFDDDINDELHSYKIEFTKDSRLWKYCQCTPEDSDYRKDKKCCGHDCDWVSPAITISKIIDMGSCEWDGDEHDYWEFEDNFYKSKQGLSEESIRKEKESEIKDLKEKIYQMQLELVNLRKELSDVTTN